MLAVVLALESPHAGADPSAEALSNGQAANRTGRAALDAGSASSVVPGYTASPPETGYRFADRDAAGNARLANCALLPADPACAAQRAAMDTARSPRPTLAGEASVSGAHAAAGQPGTVLGDLSPFYSGCTGAGGQPAACVPGRYCIEGRCFDTSHAPDADFTRTMTFIEAAREAGVYLTADLRVFAGEPNSCTTGLLNNCCSGNAGGAAMSNQSVYGVGSRLVYDTLVNSGNREFVTQGTQALLTGGGFSGAYSSYGITVAVNGTALPAGSAVLYAGDTLVIAFDPWSLVIAIIIYVVMEMLSCDPSENMLALKQGANLCVSVGTYCSSCIRVLGKCVTCIERTTGKCCFNSVLARLINEQGRAQLGKGWGTGESQDCSGFTVAELQALDFSRMDLSSFYGAIDGAASSLAPRRAAAVRP